MIALIEPCWPKLEIDDMEGISIQLHENDRVVIDFPQAWVPHPDKNAKPIQLHLLSMEDAKALQSALDEFVAAHGA